MKKCPNCGKENQDDSSFCIRCGTDIHEVQLSNDRQSEISNPYAITGFVLSFFIPIAGLIVCYIGQQHKEEYESGNDLIKWGIGISIASLVIQILASSFWVLLIAMAA